MMETRGRGRMSKCCCRGSTSSEVLVNVKTVFTCRCEGSRDMWRLGGKPPEQAVIVRCLESCDSAQLTTLPCNQEDGRYGGVRSTFLWSNT